MSLTVFFLSGVPLCSVTSGAVTVFFSRFHITVSWLLSIDEFPFHLVLYQHRVLAFRLSLPEVLHFLIR